MPENGLEEKLDQWLRNAGRSWRLRFPPLLEARFEQETRAARCRWLCGVGAFGCLVTLLLYPGLRAAMPDIPALDRIVTLWIILPVGIATAALMRFDPPPLLRESAQAAGSVGVALGLACLFATSRTCDPSLFVAAILLLLIYLALTAQVRFWFAVAATIIVLVAFDFGLRHTPNLSGATARYLVLVVSAASVFTMMANWRLEHDQRRNYALMLREQLRREQLSERNRELDELVLSDALTGLANRRAYDGWLDSVWRRAAANRQPLGLVILDVDRFKDYNDFYGHPAGDACLRSIAQCLRDRLRGTSDLIARLGGEEFVVLLPGLDAAVSADIAERLRQAVEALELPHLGITPPGNVTISGGAACVAVEGAATHEALFAAADAALYQAKQAGRNRIAVAEKLSAEIAAPGVPGTPSGRHVGLWMGPGPAPLAQAGPA